jgi:hypothetical protein
MKYAVMPAWLVLAVLAGCMEVQSALSPPSGGEGQTDYGPVVNEHTQFGGTGNDPNADAGGDVDDGGEGEPDDGENPGDGETPDDPDGGVDDGDGTDDPGDGDDPDDGVDPDDPVDPEDPIDPEDPDDPGEPDDMETDGIPELPADLEEVALETGLRYIVIESGVGQVATVGDAIEAHYTGWLEDGTKFDSSVDRGVPFEFTLGSGQVIAGWDQGFEGMTEGERRRLIIPSDLGYGDAGRPPQIPGGATLIFDVELLTVNP